MSDNFAVGVDPASGKDRTVWTMATPLPPGEWEAVEAFARDHPEAVLHLNAPTEPAPLFPGVDLGAQPVRPTGRCPQCGAVLGAAILPTNGERYHLPDECPLEGWK